MFKDLILKIGTFFSGIGAPEEALKKLNINYSLEFACEIDKFARQSFLANHKPKIFYNDITKIDYSKLPFANGIIAGFPCQAFSVAGKREGFNDDRGNLFFYLLKALKTVQPDFFILENVKGILSHDKSNTFKVILENLENLNYKISYQVLNTKDYGIPQNRERIFIIGFKDKNINFNFPDKQVLKVFLEDLIKNKVDDKYFASERYLNYIKNTKYRMNKNIIQKKKYSCTLLSSGNILCIDINNIGKQNIVLKQGAIRRLTPLEYFRLQGFTDDFFYNCKSTGLSNTQLYKQAGNAITVNVLMEIFKELFKALSIALKEAV